MRTEPQAPLWAENGTFSDEKQAVYRKKHVKIQEIMAVGHRTAPCSMKRFTLCVVLAVYCFMLCSCKVAWGYGVIPFTPEEKSPEELLSDIECEAYRAGSVVVVPSLKPCSSSEYGLAFLAYSKEKVERIEIERISLQKNGSEIPLDEKEMYLQINDKKQDLFYGSKRLCKIPMEILGAVRGDCFTLSVEVSVYTVGTIVSQKHIVYTAKTYQRFGFVLPT